MVKLSSVEDDGLGEEHQVIWEVELLDLGGDEPGKQQRERDMAALRRRLNEIPEEIRRESDHIRSRFANPSARLFPVAVTWLIPRRAVLQIAESGPH